MTKGVHFIDGQEYLLCGRENSKESAVESAKRLRKEWQKVRIIKVWQFDFMLYVHGRR